MRGMFYRVLTLGVILLAGVPVLFLRRVAWWPEGPRNLSGLLRQSDTAKPSPAPAQPLEAKSEIGGRGLAKPAPPRPTWRGASGTRPLPPPPPPQGRYHFPLPEHIPPQT